MSLDDPDDPASVYLTELEAAILAAVVGHPYELPTLPEVRFAVGEPGDDRVDAGVERLVDRGLLTTVSFEAAPPADGPRTFYGTSEFGESVLQRRLPPDRARRLAAGYARLEKPEEIRRQERAPRPSRDHSGPE